MAARCAQGRAAVGQQSTAVATRARLCVPLPAPACRCQPAVPACAQRLPRLAAGAPLPLTPPRSPPLGPRRHAAELAALAPKQRTAVEAVAVADSLYSVHLTEPAEGNDSEGHGKARGAAGRRGASQRRRCCAPKGRARCRTCAGAVASRGSSPALPTRRPAPAEAQQGAAAAGAAGAGGGGAGGPHRR